MDEKILNELLKHLQKYQIVYQYIGTHGYRTLETVKVHLMNNCNMAESTARLWINEIRKIMDYFGMSQTVHLAPTNGRFCGAKRQRCEMNGQSIYAAKGS